MNFNPIERKLVLGTVQLGLSYGINNHFGKPRLPEAFKILESTSNYHIEILDSADAYGDSIEVIGSFLRANKSINFKVISKFIADGTPLSAKVQKTLRELSLDRLYAYMYHRFGDYQSGQNRSELVNLKKENRIERIGVSVYNLEELKSIVEDESVSLIQIPFNPFDAAPEKIELIKEARARGKEIHVRSVFLQGLFFKKAEELTGNLRELQEPLKNFHQIRNSYNLDVMQAALNFALHQDFVDKVLIGVETSQQLDENVKAILPSFSLEINDRLKRLYQANNFILNPSNWKP